MDGHLANPPLMHLRPSPAGVDIGRAIPSQGKAEAGTQQPCSAASTDGRHLDAPCLQVTVTVSDADPLLVIDPKADIGFKTGRGAASCLVMIERSSS